jgi:hypothetical protein
MVWNFIFLELRQKLFGDTSHVGMEKKVQFVIFHERAKVRKLKFMLTNEIALRMYGFVDIIIGSFLQTFKK